MNLLPAWTTKQLVSSRVDLKLQQSGPVNAEALVQQVKSKFCVTGIHAHISWFTRCQTKCLRACEKVQIKQSSVKDSMSKNTDISEIPNFCVASRL